MDISADFKAFQDLISSSLVNVTRSAGQVSNQDLGFHRSASENLSRSLDRQNAHLLRLTNKLLKAATRDTTLRPPPTLHDQDSIDDNWRQVIDAVDNLLEKADTSLDEFSGVLKRHDPANQSVASPSPKPVKPARAFGAWSRDSMQKPQELFHVKPDNYATGSFKPLLSDKPHAIIPLEDSIGDPESGHKHPYASEIEQYRYPPAVYQKQPPIPWVPADQNEAIYVDTEEGVATMLQELKGAKEIAIDLEHHDQHSYIGLVSLMQISTREKDWIIDTLKPWRQNLQVLNQVFADPTILKVFQGSSMDMVWLQRDLGLYVVGLFDTYYASAALNFPGRSLKYLLARFANFDAQKQFQLADWRVRPLPAELIDYARSDTHYLLNIYDNLRNMLIDASTPQNDLIDYVLVESKREALQVYQHPVYDAETGRGPAGWLSMLSSRNIRFDNQQFAVFRSVHAWRDRKARERDEGIQHVLPNRFLWQIAENMPTTPYTFTQVCRGGSTKPVMDHVVELCDAVKHGKAQGKTGKSMFEFFSEQRLAIDADGSGYSTPNAPRRSRHLTWRKEETTLSGVAATLQQIASETAPSPAATNENVTVDAPIDTPVAVRTASSQLWGNVIPQHPHQASQMSVTLTALQTILPLPSTDTQIKPSSLTLLRDVIADERVSAPSKVLPPTTAVGVSNPSEPFTLNELSRSSRKRKASDASVNFSNPITTRTKASGSNETDTSSTTSSTASSPTSFIQQESKTETKATPRHQKPNKAERRALKASQAEAASAAQASTSQPFDYASAPSLLNTTADVTDGKEKGVKRMNPFAKSLDTTTGAKRSKMGKELAGKSMTFKS
ncbi:hypothetical protein PV10_00565 [Exophiala mesophila]|uniref:HRDC domain-containing protein n=1 Tax=Exophiala mesophila TaxID=212818 RepID=A0A0D1Y7L7_EXOME|nr:uncharacterized protein PV10_00565 [Exophiala mesophila]KIV96741.1 hypothetical protein PV10_00565 [Exophiala mesophila]